MSSLTEPARAVVPPYAWIVSRAATANNTGLFTSLALNRTGEPYIAFFDQTKGSIRVAHRTAGQWSTESVAFVGSWQGDTNIGIGLNESLFISFVGADPHNLELANRGPTGWTITSVDAGYS